MELTFAGSSTDIDGCCCVSVVLQVVADVSLQLCFLYLTRTPCMALAAIGKSSQPTPYVWLSGALLVAVKLIYGLGGAAGAVSGTQLCCQGARHPVLR
jgi:hypothetical protein